MYHVEDPVIEPIFVLYANQVIWLFIASLLPKQNISNSYEYSKQPRKSLFVWNEKISFYQVLLGYKSHIHLIFIWKQKLMVILSAHDDHIGAKAIMFFHKPSKLISFKLKSMVKYDIHSLRWANASWFHIYYNFISKFSKTSQEIIIFVMKKIGWVTHSNVHTQRFVMAHSWYHPRICKCCFFS